MHIVPQLPQQQLVYSELIDLCVASHCELFVSVLSGVYLLA